MGGSSTICVMRNASPRPLGDQRRLGWASTLMINYFWMRGDYDRALASGQRACAIAVAFGELALQARAHFSRPGVPSPGRLSAGHDVLDGTCALTGALCDEHYGSGLLSVASRNLLVGCLCELGAFAEGKALGDEAIQMVETADNLFSRVEAYSNVGQLYLGTRETCSRPFPCSSGGSRSARQRISALRPQLRLGVGDAVRSDRALRRGPAAPGAGGGTGYRHGPRESCIVLDCPVEHRLSAGWPSGGGPPLAQRALALARPQGERGYQAYALRLLEGIHAQHQPPDVAPAETHYQEALALTEELGMRPLQAHCHRGLGTLYAITGQVEQSRAELSRLSICTRPWR